MDLAEIKDILCTAYIKFDNIKLGIAGSYANGTQRKSSDIDIVIDEDSMQVEIMEYIKSLFKLKVDILWLELLKKEDEELDNIALKYNLPINKNSVYKTVIKEVIWI